MQCLLTKTILTMEWLIHSILSNLITSLFIFIRLILLLKQLGHLCRLSYCSLSVNELENRDATNTMYKYANNFYTYEYLVDWNYKVN